MGAFGVFKRLAAAALCAALLPGCSTSLLYDAYQIARTHYNEQHRMQGVQEYLNRRYQPILRNYLPAGTRVESAVCPHMPDAGGYDIETCWMTAGSRAYPIRVSRNPIDRRLNSALGVTPMTRSTLETRLAQRIFSAYGVEPQVRCDVPERFIPPPRSTYSCTLRGSNAIGSRLTAVLPDGSYWIVAVASPPPPDERALRDALKANPRRVPGRIVAGIIYRREEALSRKYAPSIRIGKTKCPKLLDLRPRHAAECDVVIDEQMTTQLVTMLDDRLTFHSEGAVVDFATLKRITLAQLSKMYKTSAPVHAAINCDGANEIFTGPMGYHYCEITGPPYYPKRLAIATMDAEGHYDVFFTDFSQSAYSK